MLPRRLAARSESSSTPNLKNEESAIEQLHKLYIPPDKLGMAAPLKNALVDVVNSRTEVTLRYLEYRDTPCDLPFGTNNSARSQPSPPRYP